MSALRGEPSTRCIASVIVLLLLGGLPVTALAQSGETNTSVPAVSRMRVPDLTELVSSFRPNEMRVVAQRYQADRGNLTRYYNVTLSPTTYARLKWFGAEWLAALRQLDVSGLSEESRNERTRLMETVERDLRQLDDGDAMRARTEPLVPFSKIIIDLDESRRRVDKIDARKTAGVVDDLAKRVILARRLVEGETVESGVEAVKMDPALAREAVEAVTTLRTTLKNWFNFYNNYDPLFTWWLAQPYPEADKALENYAAALRRKAEGLTPEPEKARATLPDPLPATPIRLAGKTPQVPNLKELISMPQSSMRPVIERFQGNRGGRRGGSGRNGGQPQSREFYQEWLAALGKLDFDRLGHEDQINYLLLKNRVEYQLRRIDFRNEAEEDTVSFVPFEPAIERLGESQNQPEKFEAAKATEFLQELKEEIDSARTSATNQLEKADAAVMTRANRAVRTLGNLRNQMQDWYDRYSSDWQTNQPLIASYKSIDQALEDYAAFLRDRSGATARRDGSDIVGRPIGREALMVELAGEMVSYTPEELLAIGEKEFAWCIAEMKRAARQMGLGDDWRKAVEKAKELHVPVGEQPYLIRDLAWDAVDYLEKHDLITIPEVARETWRVQMMSLRRQMVNPFFTGGETISVSYPLSEMSHDQKLQSMRGNNIPFARATVFHELIPGHELQGFAAARYHTERRLFGTPFYGEGWAVYWEILLYERGYHGSPENRIGALFWRLHRCARIVFSLNFHLQKWTPQQCIDYLVNEVGHERDNATAEVRRSFVTSYAPLYQAAYLLGALQLRGLNRELVGRGKLSQREFHDAVLKEGSMPIALLRTSLTREKLNRDYRPEWRFYDSTITKLQANR